MAAAGCWEISFDFTDVKRYQAGRCPGPMLRFLEAWQYHLEEAKLEVQPSQPLGESLTVRMRDASWHFWRAVLPLKTLQRACQERWCCKESAAKVQQWYVMVDDGRWKFLLQEEEATM